MRLVLWQMYPFKICWQLGAVRLSLSGENWTSDDSLLQCLQGGKLWEVIKECRLQSLCSWWPATLSFKLGGACFLRHVFTEEETHLSWNDPCSRSGHWGPKRPEYEPRRRWPRTTHHFFQTPRSRKHRPPWSEVLPGNWPKTLSFACKRSEKVMCAFASPRFQALMGSHWHSAEKGSPGQFKAGKRRNRGGGQATEMKRP